MRFFAVIRSTVPIPEGQRLEIERRISSVHAQSAAWKAQIGWHEFCQNNVYTTFIVSDPIESRVSVEDSFEFMAGFADNGSIQEVKESYFLKNGRMYLSDSAPGTFVAASHRKSDGTLLGFASRPCAVPAFYYDRHNIFAMSSDAIVVALIAEVLDRTTVRLSRGYAADYLAWGYSYREKSPFEDVQALPPGACLIVRGVSGVKIREYSRFDQVDFKDATVAEKAKSLAESLTASVGRIPDSELVNLRLSGGKDSRVLLSALAGGQKSFEAETRGRQSDLEVGIASEIAKRAGARHIVSNVAMASPDGLFESASTSIQRMAGHLSAEPQQIMFEGANPQHIGQYLMMGHSHIQRGGFARTMRNDPSRVLASLQKQCSPFVSDELRRESDDWVTDWYSGQSFSDYIEPLYELHVQKRASFYLLPQYRDYSNVVKLHYPLIGHDFVSKCDALTVFDRVSEQVIFLAAVAQFREIMNVPLCDDLWNFDRNGKSDILPEEFDARTGGFTLPETGKSKSGGDSYNSASIANLSTALHFIVDSGDLGFLSSVCSQEVLDILKAKEPANPLEKLKAADPVRFDLLRRYIWRMYAVCVWSTRAWFSA
ncbi:hypothetical protein [Corynebacterium sp. BF-R-2]|uniref:hypothetical protein n=1 Tax=Corynebacterium sp. BF-R-2 TaxID=2943494 RepID=UPI00211DBEE8|nr:hypothetical protein [Corynebacterium sp. BF-R-2]MCQ9677972.1 hypothetical protein [Corynebacterium sp. BF-R-2]